MAEKELKVKMSFDVSKFEDGIKKIDKSMRLLDSQTKAGISSLEQFGSKTDSLKTRADSLSKKIDMQKDKVKLLSEEYKKSVQEKGADSEATQKLEMKLNTATTSLNKMQSGLKELNAEIRNQPTALSKMNRGLDTVNEKMATFGNKVASFGTKLTMGITAPVIAMAKLSVDAIMGQIREETKLITIMEQRMNATKEQYKAVIDLTSAQQRLGIIGDDVQIAGAQQVATFLKQADSVNTLLPAMNNLLAQQKGYGATTGDAVNVANMMGKVLEGQIGALRRVGISFSDAEEKVLKFGTESERASMLAQVINNNVGQMNQALAGTTEGRIVQVKNAFGDFQEELGKQLLPILDKYIPKITNLINKFLDLDDTAKKNIISFGGLLASIPPAMIVFGKFTQIAGNTTGMFTKMTKGIADTTVKSIEFGKNFGINFGTKVQATADKTFGYINKITGGSVDKISNSFGTLGEKIKSPISNFINNVKMPISNMTLAEDFEKHISPMFAKFQGIFGKLGVIGQKGFSMITNIAGIAMKMVAPVAVIGLLLAGLGLAEQKFGTQIDQFVRFALEKAPAIIQGFITGMVSKLPDLINVGTDLLLKLVDVIIANLPIIIIGAVQIITALAEGVVANLDKIIDAIIKLLDIILMSLIENLPMLLDAGLKILVGLVEGISNNIEKIIDMIIKVLLALITTIIKNLPKIIEAGIKILVALIEGLAKAIPQLIKYLPEIISAIFKAFKEIDWKELGKNIIIGLVDGLKALGNLVWDTLKGIGQSALNGFKKMFGINSPSTVFMGYGENINEGLAIGINDNADQVDDSLKGIRKLTDSVFTNKYDYNLSGVSRNSTAGRNINNTSNTTSNNSTINIIIQKVENYRKQDIKNLVDEISYYLKKKKIATGGV